MAMSAWSFHKCVCTRTGLHVWQRICCITHLSNLQYDQKNSRAAEFWFSAAPMEGTTKSSWEKIGLTIYWPRVKQMSILSTSYLHKCANKCSQGEAKVAATVWEFNQGAVLPCSAFSFHKEKDYIMQPCSQLTVCGHHETSMKTTCVCGP